MGERLPNWQSAANLVRKIAANYRLPYYTLSPTYSVCADHGYLMGEVDVCPICGKPTEVYSRITGYYRPVQNWNKGKTQEFADRKTYSISGLGRSIKEARKEVAKPEAKEEVKANEAATDGTLLLFTTKTCPNCKIVKEMLGKKNIAYQQIDAEENEDLCDKYQIMQAPTLVAINGDSYQKYANASNIIKYLNN